MQIAGPPVGIGERLGRRQKGDDRANTYRVIRGANVDALRLARRLVDADQALVFVGGGWA